MNLSRYGIAALIGITFGCAAWAQEATPDSWMEAQAFKSREQVREELRQARRDGSIGFTAPGYDFAPQAEATKLRGQVLAELLLARQNGEYDEINGEVYAFRRTLDPVYAGGAALASR